MPKFRVDLDDFVPFQNGQLELALLQVGLAQIVVSLPVVTVDLGHALPFHNGFFQLAPMVIISVGQIPVGRPVFFLERNGLLH